MAKGPRNCLLLISVDGSSATLRTLLYLKIYLSRNTPLISVSMIYFISTRNVLSIARDGVPDSLTIGSMRVQDPPQ